MDATPDERKWEYLMLLFPLGDRQWSPDQQDVVVRGRPITSHDVLEMHAKELPSETAIVFERKHVLEPNPPCQRVAPIFSHVDADALDRVKVQKGHDILTGLAIDPSQRRFDR